MPGRDGTGPRGQGPMTGGGMGWCVVPIAPGDTGNRRSWFGTGRGRGSGFQGGGGGGHRWRHRGRATGMSGAMHGSMDQPATRPPFEDKDAEIEALKQKTLQLERMVEELRKRISEKEKS